MKTIYPTLGIVLSVILTSCGMSTNFNKRKYTNFKKSKAEFKIATNESSHQEDVISYQAQSERFTEKEAEIEYESVSEVVEDNQVIEIEDVFLEQGYKKVTNKRSVKKQSTVKQYFESNSHKSVLLQKSQYVKEDPESSKIGLTILLSLLFILLFFILLYFTVFGAAIAAWIYGMLYGLGVLLLGLGIVIMYVILCVKYLIKINR